MATPNTSTHFYKSFLCKPVVTKGYTTRYVGTLQGLRFTGVTLTDLKAKIDRNHAMIAELTPNQAYRANNAVTNNFMDTEDYLLDSHELSSIINHYVPGNNQSVGAY